MSDFFKVLFISVLSVTFLIMLFIFGAGTKPFYPEPTNYTNYGFYPNVRYVRTCNRNPYTSPNGSNKDTLTLLEFKDHWLRFDNGEMFRLHSEEFDYYLWRKLK